MPRRAARPPSPALDLSGYLYALEALPCPLDPIAIWGRHAPLEVEVGSGKGLFLTSAAAANPQHDFLGVEIAQSYARHVAGRLVQRGLGNARVLHGDAQRFFRQWLAEGSVSAVHVYFPDPWWKKRHRKRRVLNAEFLRQVARVLADQGALHFWTDVAEYYETTLALLEHLPELAGPLPVPELAAAHDLDYRTHFERRTRQAGQAVYRSLFVRAPRP